jgi:hypothetical protein
VGEPSQPGPAPAQRGQTRGATDAKLIDTSPERRLSRHRVLTGAGAADAQAEPQDTVGSRRARMSSRADQRHWSPVVDVDASGASRPPNSVTLATNASQTCAGGLSVAMTPNVCRTYDCRVLVGADAGGVDVHGPLNSLLVVVDLHGGPGRCPVLGGVVFESDLSPIRRESALEWPRFRTPAGRRPPPDLVLLLSGESVSRPRTDSLESCAARWSGGAAAQMHAQTSGTDLQAGRVAET